MSDHKDRARRYHHAIREILLRDWDPIGVADAPEAQDEYDSYIPGIYGRLIRRISEQELFDHLWQIETEHMGLFGNRGKTVSNGASIKVSNHGGGFGVTVGLSGTLICSETLTLNGSTSGNITADVFGTLGAFGGSSGAGGTLTIQGNLQLERDANTVFGVTNIPGVAQGHDEVHVLQTTGGGVATLGGRISVTMDGTFTPGTSFLLLHADAGLNHTTFRSESINVKQVTGP